MEMPSEYLETWNNGEIDAAEAGAGVRAAVLGEAKDADPQGQYKRMTSFVNSKLLNWLEPLKAMTLHVMPQGPTGTQHDLCGSSSPLDSIHVLHPSCLPSTSQAT